MKKRIFACALCAALALGITPDFSGRAAQPAGQDGPAASAPQPGSYEAYLAEHADAADADASIELTAEQVTDGEDYAVEPALAGAESPSICTEETGFITYSFTVEHTGMYQIEAAYYPLAGKGAAMVRSLLIDGALPYDEAREVEFSRIWVNDGPIGQDARGNDIRPSQVEAPAWQRIFLRDSSGYYEEPLRIYLAAGEHTLTLESVREPLALGTLRLCTAPEAPSYAEYRQAHADAAQPSGFYQDLQGENADRKSSQVIYPVTDRSSSVTVPNSPSEIRLNTLGGEKWQTAGHWVEWEITVPESGWYKLAMRVRQNVGKGSFSTRKLTVNGTLPFAEAQHIQVYYNAAWQHLTFADEDGEPYYLYLEAGPNTLRLEAVLGKMSAFLRETFACVRELNGLYQRILMITGPVPDTYRDYQFHRQTPQLLEDLLAVADRLEALYAQYNAVAGDSGQSAASLYKLVRQTRDMGSDQRKIATSFADFKNNIVALGDFVVALRGQPLEVDYLEVASPEYTFAAPKSGFWQSLVFWFRSFLASFSDDYSNLSSGTAGADTTITVWVGSGAQAGVATAGRDQAQVIKRMADTVFTPRHSIAVELQLVSAGSLMPAVLSGNNPDVALSLGGSEPVNYAVRNAVTDLTQFPDWQEVCGRFRESAVTPLQFDGRLYGLPETQSFYMLFYREDILGELGLAVPQTWDDVIAMLPELQKQQMEFGLPPALSDAIGIGFNAFAMFLFQNGGEFYLDGGEASALGESAAIDSFFQWTKYYSEYSLVPLYDFATRFRMGDMPIAIADYTVYNQIAVFAPELRGMWSFAPVPGTRKENGDIDRSVAGNVTAGVILSASEEPEASWEFLKWWTEADTQADFGLEIESIMGTAARYATANVEAMERLPWNKADADSLREQGQWTKGVPEVPGGYYTARHIDFAFRRVYFRSDDPGETLEDVVETINQELTAKRKEFNLSTR